MRAGIVRAYGRWQMSTFLDVIEALGAALASAFTSYQNNQSVEEALISAEEELSKARARAKFPKP